MGRPPESRHEGRASRLRPWLPWLALLALALAVRALRFGTVLAGGQLRTPYAADELYHLRRIWFSVVNFPASLEFDFYLNHPLGAPPIWPPFFDWGVAALARALVGADDQHAVEVVAAWVPPVIGGLTVLAGAWLVRCSFSPAAGWVTGGLLAVLPAHVDLSAVGEVDHHGAVGLMATALVAVAGRMAGPLGPGGRVQCPVWLGLVAGAAILLWPGALLHVLVVQVFLVGQALASAAPVRRARALALSHAVAAGLLAPFCIGREWEQFGTWSLEVLSRFQPLWFAAGALTLALAAAAWSHAALGAEPRRRLGSALLLGTVGIAAAWYALPGLASSVGDAAGWFRSEPFLRVVAETRPFLLRRGVFDPGPAHRQLSLLFWLYPLALASGVAWAARRRRADTLLLLVASGAGFVATLVQSRFRDVGVLGFAWVMGPAIVWAFRSARALPGPRFAAAGVLALSLLAAGLPALSRHATELGNSVRALRGASPQRAGEAWLRDRLREVAHWVGRHTPTTSGYLDPTQRPEYGVLAAWGHGHLLRYYGERPMVQDNFGPWGGRHGSDAARRYFDSRDEGEAVAIAGALGARYVVATIRGSGHHPPLEGSIAWRLVPVRRRDGLLAQPGPALGRHRLLLVADEAGARRPGARLRAPALYEIVPGALVAGSASPGVEFVHFEATLPLPRRERLHYRATAAVGSDGRYSVRLPYPSESGYLVRSGARTRSLRVSEADVREGRTVAGPHIE